MMKDIFVINGSASSPSSNEKIIQKVISELPDFNFKVFNDLKTLPHFDPVLSSDNPPEIILQFRDHILRADAVLICSPEYIFSIPSGLKNAIEWCVSTTVFTEKPLGLIIASAHGQKAYEELQLIMRTVMSKFSEETCLLIQGVNGKFNQAGEIIDDQTSAALTKFTREFAKIIV